MKKYAVLIGNSEFPDEPDTKKLPTLACPQQDVDDLASVLADVNRGEFNVLRLKNQASHQVLRKLQQTIKQLQADDLLLVYYSGHGKPNKNNILHLTTFDTVLSELESTAIPIHRVYEIIATGKAKKIIIILDCCYSGAAGQGFRGDINDGLQQLNNSRGTYLVTASTELQVAHENTTDGYGLFTKHLIAGLQTGDADKDGDGFISMNELYDYVHDKVIAENPNQQPTRHVKDERGGLIIAKSGRDSRKDRAEKIRLLLLDFEKQHEDIAEIKTEALAIARAEIAKLLPVQLQKDQLLSDLLDEKIPLLSFVRAWDRLAIKPTTEKPAKPKTPDILVNKVEKPAQPKIIDTQVNTVEKPPKRKLSLVVSSIVVAFSLIAGWKFFPTDVKPTPIPTLPDRKQSADEKPANTATLPSALAKLESDMVAIKGDCFKMGSPDTEKERGSDEKQHQVCVEDFAIGKYEVTQAQWQAVMGANPSNFKGDDLPVERVSYNEVQDFINKLNTQTGQSYRLPTEAEWEYAARAKTTTPFYTGDCINTEQANYDGNYDYNNCGAKTGVYKQTTVAVGSYPANPWGLYDMVGNVWEWTCSAYVEQYDGSEIKCISKNDAKTQRVIRGGSWNNKPTHLRSANRNYNTPDDHDNALGFRLSRM